MDRTRTHGQNKFAYACNGARLQSWKEGRKGVPAGKKQSGTPMPSLEIELAALENAGVRTISMSRESYWLDNAVSFRPVATARAEIQRMPECRMIR